MSKSITIWNKMAKSFHNTSLRSAAHHQKYERIADEILKINPEAVLDLGCGSGLLESELCRRGFCGQAHCYDASEKMLEIARNTIRAENCFFCESLIGKDFNPGQKFDVIVAINLFFYLDEKQEFLNIVASCLKNVESLFIMVIPKPGNETSNLEFVKAHFKMNNGKSKAAIILEELRNIPAYIELAARQKELDKLEKAGEIVFDRPEKVAEMAGKAGLKLIETSDIHAGQNWMLVMKSA